MQADRITKGTVVAERLKQYDVMIRGLRGVLLRTVSVRGADGEDQFDAFVGLTAMLGVLLGFRSEGFPEDSAIQSVEGWILGQASLH